jgi:hypothetical protein
MGESVSVKMDMSYELDRIVTGSIACKEKSDMSSTELSLGDCVQARLVTQGALSINGVRRTLWVKAFYALVI